MRLPTIAETIGLEDALTASLLLNALLIVGALLGPVLTHLLAHRHFLLSAAFCCWRRRLIAMAFCRQAAWDAAAFILFWYHDFGGQQSGWGSTTGGKFSYGYPLAGVGFATGHGRLGAAIGNWPAALDLAQWG